MSKGSDAKQGTHWYVCGILLIALYPLQILCQAAPPDTAAGRALQTWLEAFNSADPANIKTYVDRYHPPTNVESVVALRQQTGAFDLWSVEHSDPLRVVFRVKQRQGQGFGYGDIRISPGALPQIQRFALMPIPASAVIDVRPLTEQDRHAAIESVNEAIRQYYVFPASASDMAKDLDQRERNGQYSAIDDGTAFATQLTTDMRAVSHDKHLSVNYVPFLQSPDVPGSKPKPSAADQELAKQGLLRDNCGFREAKILSGNVGYLRFDVFSDPTLCAESAAAAMRFLANTDAVIFDLRDNHGGDPRMVAFLISYLFDKPTHINDLYNRHDDSTTPFWTLPFVPGEKMVNTAAFILTSHGTFSAAEEFAYDLQSLHRATVVGETTGGGAHPVDIHKVNDHFSVRIPVARAINPVTKGDWEGVGVRPDVTVTASEALERAQELARSHVQR